MTPAMETLIERIIAHRAELIRLQAIDDELTARLAKNTNRSFEIGGNLSKLETDLRKLFHDAAIKSDAMRFDVA